VRRQVKRRTTAIILNRQFCKAFEDRMTNKHMPANTCRELAEKIRRFAARFPQALDIVAWQGVPALLHTSQHLITRLRSCQPSPRRTPQHISAPVSTSPHLPSPRRTSQHISAPRSISPHLAAHLRTCKHFTAPHRTSQHFATPVSTSQHLRAPAITWPHLTAPPSTSPQLPAPHRTS